MGGARGAKAMLVINDNAAASRFEMPSGDAVAFVEYRRAGDRVVLTHTEVPEALSGQGIGSRLVAGVLDRLRSDGAKVVAQCEFVAAFIERHPGYRSVLADE
jgi:predicted GNAT family acetyltransferase